MHKICAYVDDNMVLHLFPRNPLEVLGLKYLGKEIATHGMSLIKIEEDPNMYKQLKAQEMEEDRY